MGPEKIRSTHPAAHRKRSPSPRGDRRSHWFPAVSGPQALPLKRGGGLRNMREVLMVYLGGVILIAALSTTIDGEEKVGLDHIMIAAFGWPIFTSILALKALSNR